MPAISKWAHSTYYKRLSDGRYEYGFLKNDREIPVGVTDNSVRAFWWCQVN
jgi:hypothetical protein